LLHNLLGEPQAPVSVVAGVGMDIRVWPPPPSRPNSGVWGRPPNGATVNREPSVGRLHGPAAVTQRT
jgi:hypothetical protein